jgi:hypothetical protein
VPKTPLQTGKFLSLQPFSELIFSEWPGQTDVPFSPAIRLNFEPVFDKSRGSFNKKTKAISSFDLWHI